jgi:hypothetical protein
MRASAFFLPPYSQIVEVLWSKGRRRDRRELRIRCLCVPPTLVLKYLTLGTTISNLHSTCSKFDLRPMFMSFEFNCRTSDNVELILEGTFFWEINDVQAMFKSTGDVC